MCDFIWVWGQHEGQMTWRTHAKSNTDEDLCTTGLSVMLRIVWKHHSMSLLHAYSGSFIFLKYFSTVYVCGVSLCLPPAEVSGQGVTPFVFVSDWGLSMSLLSTAQRRTRSYLCLFKYKCAVTFVTKKTNKLLVNTLKHSLRSGFEKVGRVILYW